MAMDVGGSKGSLKADINVTPLVDVMLVLLIIMMLVAPMLQAGVSVNLPIAANSGAKPDNPQETIVAVDAQNRLYLNGVEVPRSEFSDRVKAALEEKTEKVVLIKGDKEANYSAVMDAMDYVRKAGIENMGLITDPKVDPNKPNGEAK